MTEFCWSDDDRYDRTGELMRSTARGERSAAFAVGSDRMSAAAFGADRETGGTAQRLEAVFSRRLERAERCARRICEGENLGKRRGGRGRGVHEGGWAPSARTEVEER